MTPVRGLVSAVLGAAVMLAAGGCAHMEPAEPAGDGLTFPERRARLEAIDTWEMRGRLAVDTGERAFQGSFRWLQDGEQSTLQVRAGPFGASTFQVAGGPSGMTVTARGETRVLDDPETELSQLLGWWMPVDSLSAWLVGLPDPRYPAVPELGPRSALTALDQRLWHLEYDSYQLSEGLLLPRRIDMTHGALELRVTVDAWNPAGAATRALN